ncbi:MAG TPA: dephospho-CoA kinase [Chitinophagaceae bacterium]
MVLRIGLTGGIGSGKSTVAKIFETLGISVFYADMAARQVMNDDEELKQKIKETFGDAAYGNEMLNRKYIADIVFNDPFKLEQLNALVHPAAIAMAEKWMQQQTAPYAIKEAALFFEAGSTEGLDYIVGVYAPKHLRVQRVMQRDNVTREEVLARMSKQIDEEMKMRLCDFVIVNDEQNMVIPQVLQLHEKFISQKNDLWKK